MGGRQSLLEVFVGFINDSLGAFAAWPWDKIDTGIALRSPLGAGGTFWAAVTATLRVGEWAVNGAGIGELAEVEIGVYGKGGCVWIWIIESNGGITSCVVR